MRLYPALRPFLFRLDAEAAHGWGVRAASLGRWAGPLLRRAFPPPDARLAQTLWGLPFAGPVGLAAGFDKDARLADVWPTLGFGFAEVGSVTARPSDGNPRPRAFRLPDDRALVNRMGLNNAGAQATAHRLAGLDRDARRARGFVLAVNVAKTHSPDILGDAGVDDFRETVRHVLPHADLLVLNVSCPNTAEGKTFETPDALDALLTAVMAEHGAQASPVPVLVKLSPPAASGVDAPLVDELVALALSHGVAGFVATNTASDRDGLATDARRLSQIGAGGLSGRPLATRATALVRHLYRTVGDRVPIVGVGGVDSAEAAYARLRAGASLVELYTGLVYEGPGLPSQIHAGLVRLLDRDGLGRLADAVGLDA